MGNSESGSGAKGGGGGGPAIDPAASERMRLARLGDHLRLQGQNKAAIESYRKALQYDPNAHRVLVALASCLVQEYLRTRKKEPLVEAKEVAARAVGQAPDNAGAHCMLGEALGHLKERKKAEEHIRIAIKLAPQNAEYRVSMGNLMRRWRKPYKALDWYHEALTLNPRSTSALVNCANHWYYRKGDLAKTEDYTRQALAIAPEYAPALVLMGFVLLQQGKIAEAVEHARLVINRDPNSRDALFLIAVIETRRNMLRGLGFRIALWYGQKGNRYWFTLVCVLAAIVAAGYGGKNVAPYIVQIFYVFLLGFILYLRYSVKAMMRYVDKNYLSPQQLKKDF
jgi:tetratricopeptide (TPR) repeat protein